ncbi:phosphoglycerate kinase [Archaeoglobus neptunius]|uniref:phosphoglycerate kinase n=1 Tax=Archaeoglobus neptunius TaxID=2798580 RepID=UPI001925BE01|nr:phosphoglycerate kinase [Archaeoglobus neptunius]
MIDGLPTLDDIPFYGKTVLLRVDINSPIVDSTILDTARFESHLPTIEDLSSTKLILLAHQSRPGKKDFTTLETHALTLSRLLGRKVEYVDEIFSRNTVQRIKDMEDGEILLLENVRFYSEEQLNRTPEEHAESHLVRKLKSVVDLFVNDAFSASHRNHASLVGFVPVLPSVVGRLVEREILALSKPLKGEGKKLFVLGGTKIKDSVKVMKNVLKNSIADKVVLTGVVANYFLMLKGEEIGEVNRKIIEDNKEGVRDEDMKILLEKYSDRILLPVDFGVEKDGVRADIPLEKFDGRYKIMDIGLESVTLFSSIIPEYDYVVLNGPAGVFEDDRFSLGTYEILKAATKASYSVVGGGHIASAARLFGLSDRFSHVSTAGGACIRFLSGEKLVALEAIKEYWQKKWGGEIIF